MMKFIACSSFVFLSFMTMSIISKSGGQSTSLLDFSSAFSGRFTNRKQVVSDVTHNDKIKHTQLDFLILPVDIPALHPDLTFYAVEKVNGQIVRKYILIITLNDEGIILMQPRNFTDPNRIEKELPDPADFINFKPEDLSRPKKECLAYYTEVTSAVFSGTWPDCINYINGVPMSYGMTVTCDFISGTVTWKSAPENMSPVPYNVLKVESFPLPQYVTENAGDWVNPCGNVENHHI